MSYRRKVFQDFRFDEKYSGYSHGEDAEFSYRVSQKYIMYCTSYAKAFHNQASDKKEWYGTGNFAKSRIRAQVNLFCKHLNRNPLNFIALFWSWLGMLIWSGIICPNKDYFIGLLKAMKKEFLNIFKLTTNDSGDEIHHRLLARRHKITLSIL